jgi:UDP-glucose 4-epimerase
LLYIVTGCAGFIGSTLTDRLLADGEDVIGIDCFRDYYDPQTKRANIAAAAKSPNFTLLEADLSRKALPDAEELTGGRPFVIHHLAAQVGVRSSWGREFSQYTRDNVTATQKLLEWARTAPSLKNLVFASSSSVYGNVESLPMREDATIPRPYSPYGVTKLAAEHLVSLYRTNYGLPTVSCRFFTVYGPRQRPDMAFHRFILAGLAGQPITVFGNGQQTRDFTYVGDIVAGLRKAEPHPKGEVFNLGGGNRVSLNDALSTLQKVLEADLDITREDVQHGDVKDTWAATDKARRHLDWVPATTLEEGLSRELEWIKRAYAE